MRKRKTNNHIKENVLRKCFIDTESKEELKKYEEIIEKTIVETERFSRALWRFYDELIARHNKIKDLVPAELLLSLIVHLRKIINMRIENRNLNVNIVIFTKDLDLSSYVSYPLQANENGLKTEQLDAFFSENTNFLYRLYKCVNSPNVFFAFYYCKDTNVIKYEGVKNFASGKKIENICDSNTIGFSITNGSPCIRIFNDLQRVADYVLSETTGEWIIRFQKDLSERLNACISAKEDIIYLLSVAIMDIANDGHGAILIITKNDSELQGSQAPCSVNGNENLSETIKNGYFFNYAAYDGAVVIINDEGVLKVNNFGIILNPNKDIPKESAYKELLRITNSGSRHEKAVRYACEKKEDCVIVISENHTVSVLQGEKPIYWRDDPNPLNQLK